MPSPRKTAFAGGFHLAPLQVMENAVSAGHLGAKSGAGLITWPDEKLQTVLQRRQNELMTRRRDEKPVSD